VVVVHPRDRSVWAICARGRAEVRALRLVAATTEHGEVRCSWQDAPDAIDFRLAGGMKSLSRLRLSYNGRIPLVTGVKQGGRTIVSIRPYLDQSPYRFQYSDLGGDILGSRPSRNWATTEVSLKIAA
jgi:hypothetical protein